MTVHGAESSFTEAEFYSNLKSSIQSVKPLDKVVAVQVEVVVVFLGVWIVKLGCSKVLDCFHAGVEGGANSAHKAKHRSKRELNVCKCAIFGPLDISGILFI